MDELRVGVPRQGDRFSYGDADATVHHAFEWSGTRDIHDAWNQPVKVDVLTARAGDGVKRYGFPGGAHVPIYVEGPNGAIAGFGGAEGRDAFLTGSNDSTMRLTGMSLYFIEAYPVGNFPCLERGGWQGRTIKEIGTMRAADLCAGFSGFSIEPGPWQSIDGIASKRFAITFQAFSLSTIWLAPEVPYPMAIAFCNGGPFAVCDDPSEASLVLTGYAPGDGEPLLLGTTDARPRPASSPEVKPLHRGLPVDGVSEFSPDEALDSIEMDESLAEHHDWRSQHPGAWLASATHYSNIVPGDGGDVPEFWSFTWADATGSASHVFSREDGDCRAAPPLPFVLPSPVRSCRPENDGEIGPGCPCPQPRAGDSVLTFAEALRLFEERRLTPEQPIWGYTYSASAAVSGTMRPVITVLAAERTPDPPEEGGLPPLFGAPGRGGMASGESVDVDALTGRVLVHSYTTERTFTWMEEPGLLERLTDEGASSSFGVSTQSAAFTLAASPDKVYVAPGTLAFAALLALLAGARLLASTVVLYTRLTKKDVLAHPRRASILGTLEDEPGLSIQEISERTEIRGGALRHHLAVLVRAKVLIAVDVAGSVRHYPAGVKPSPQVVREIILASGGSEARLLQRIRETPGVHAAQLAREMGVSRPAIHFGLQRLMRRGLLRTERAGRRTLLYPID